MCSFILTTPKSQSDFFRVSEKPRVYALPLSDRKPSRRRPVWGIRCHLHGRHTVPRPRHLAADTPQDLTGLYLDDSHHEGEYRDAPPRVTVLLPSRRNRTGAVTTSIDQCVKPSSYRRRRLPLQDTKSSVTIKMSLKLIS